MAPCGLSIVLKHVKETALWVTPLRIIRSEALKAAAKLFPVIDARDHAKGKTYQKKKPK